MIRDDLTEEEYHRLPALSAGGAFLLMNECPAIYWRHSPFNPEAVPVKASGAMDIGTALHLAALEPARFAERVTVIDADAYRSNAAKAARDDAVEVGRVPLLVRDLDLVLTLSEALRKNDYVAAMLEGAQFEVSFTWDAETAAGHRLPCKARADIVTHDGRIGDLKVSASASPEFFMRQAWNQGHYLRSPWYQDGWREAVAGMANLPEYWYVVVGNKPPHLVTVIGLDERATEWGRQVLRGALETLDQCLTRRIWPPYEVKPVTIGLPAWAEYKLADKEQTGRFSAADIRAAFQLLAP